jgi:hypothetical protein
LTRAVCGWLAFEADAIPAAGRLVALVALPGRLPLLLGGGSP